MKKHYVGLQVEVLLLSQQQDILTLSGGDGYEDDIWQ